MGNQSADIHRGNAEKTKVDKTEKFGDSALIRNTRKMVNAAILSLGIAGFSGPANAEERLKCEQDPACAQKYLNGERATLELAREEVERIQPVQEALFRNYLNPSLQQYLSRTGKDEAVNSMLEAAIQHPEFLRYKEESPGVFVLTKRPSENAQVPENLMIRIVNGHLAQVGNTKLDNRGWRDWNEEIKVMGDITSGIWADQAAYTNDRQIQEFVAYNFEMAHRLAKLMSLRTSLGAEKGNAALSKYLDLLRSHPVSKEEWDTGKKKQEGAGEAPKAEINLYFTSYSDQTGVIAVFDANDRTAPLMFISPEGYVLTEKDGKWVPEGYADTVKNHVLAKQEERLAPKTESKPENKEKKPEKEDKTADPKK